MCVSSQMYNLSNELNFSDYTLLLPTDDAVRKYLSRTNSSVLVGPDKRIECPDDDQKEKRDKIYNSQLYIVCSCNKSSLNISIGVT